MTLPKLMLSPNEPSYSFTFPDEILSAQVNNGPSRRRTDFIGAPIMAGVQFILDADEYQYFNAFYRHSLKNGVLPFLMDLNLDDADEAEYECNFQAQSLSLSAKAGEARTITATIEVKRNAPDDALDAAVIDAYETFGPGYGVEFGDLAELVNVTLPEYLPG